jgi:PGF-CTERM protein
VENLRTDTEGDRTVVLDSPINIIYTTLQGWDIQSDYAGWDNGTATIESIAADTSVDILLNITLRGYIVAASSYVGTSSIVFTVEDALSPPLLIELEASVADNLDVALTGAGDQHVDNGCSDTDIGAVSVMWDAVIKNYGNKPDSFTYTFDIAGLAEGWSVDGTTGDDVPVSFSGTGNTGSLGAKFEHGEATVSLGMWVPGGLNAGNTSGFTMTATSVADTSVTQTQSFSATVDQCYGMEMTVDQLIGSAVPGESADFTISVTNTGNGPDPISFEIMTANADWSPTLSESALTAVASGATDTTVFSMTVPSDAEATAGSGDAMIHAYSSDGVVEKSVTVSAKADQVYGVTAGYYYNATMGSISVQEGMSIQMKFNVTNTGNGNDDIALSLAGAPAWITLQDDVASVAPDGTVSLVIVVTAPLSGSVGDYVFQVVATAGDGTTTSTTGDLTATVAKAGTAGGPTTEELDEEEGGLPGFGALSAIAALGAVLLIRRRL